VLVRRSYLSQAALAALGIGCGVHSPVAPTSPGIPAKGQSTECASARAQRDRVRALLSEGRLDRSLRVIAAANAACPDEAPTTWGDEARTLADIGRYADAIALAETIEATPRATEEAREAARYARSVASRQQASNSDGESAPIPSGDALCCAGVEAKQAGDLPQSRRLFDRAIEALKLETGESSITSTVFDGFGNFYSRGSVTTPRPIAWSSDGAWLATMDRDDVVLFEARTWQPRRRLRGHGSWVTALAFSPDGKFLAAGSEDGTVCLWSFSASPAVARVLPATGRVYAVLFSPDSARLAVTSEKVAVWPMAASAGPRIFEDPLWDRPVFAPDGKSLAIGDELWELDTSSPPRPLRSDGKPVFAAFWPRMDTLVVWTERTKDRQLSGLASWNLDPKTQPRMAPPLKGGAVRGRPAFTSDGQALAYWFSSSDEFIDSAAPGPLRARALAQSKEQVLDPDAPDPSLAMSAGAHPMLAAADEGGVRVWSRNGDRWSSPVVLGKRFSVAVTSLAFSPDGEAFAAGLVEDGTVSMWDLQSPASSRLFRWPGHYIAAVAFSPDSSTLAWAQGDEWALSPEGDVQSVSLRSQASPRTAQFADQVRSLDGRRQALASPSGTRAGTTEAGAVLTLLDDWPTAVVDFSTDGDTVLGASNDGRVVSLWTFGSQLPPTALNVRRTVCSADGKQLVVAFPYLPDSHDYFWTLRETVYLWTLRETSQVSWSGWPGCSALPRTPETLPPSLFQVSDADLHALRGHSDEVTSVAFAPSGRFLATSSNDGTIRLWSLPEGKLAMTVHRGGGPTWGTVAITPDGHVAFEGQDARQRILCSIGSLTYPLDLCEERALVPDLITKVFTGDDSWRRP
jgi:WD40 repeat protein